jgi:hypothetical protein
MYCSSETRLIHIANDAFFLRSENIQHMSEQPCPINVPSVCPHDSSLKLLTGLRRHLELHTEFNAVWAK